MSEYLSPAEKSKLIMFNKDEVLKGAVQKVLLHHIYFAELLKEGKPVDLERHWIHSIVGGTRDKDDAVVGRMTRITAEASALLEDGFKDLRAFTSEVGSEEVKNPATGGKLKL